ncbi:signal peptidase I [Streptomyces sp. NPDC085946]|uniref:signal peptidase I n=1 Tax=Streptomyces sp. NPDC085946 TaxID=3365744 RepID=UPI0037D89660
MDRAGRLRGAGWVLGSVGLVLLVGSLLWLRGSYGTATVRSDSMTPAHAAGDRVLYERVGGGELERGDVVLFRAPDRYPFDAPVVQRVIGVGGDRVSCCTGAGAGERLAVNGRPLAEPYVRDGIADGMRRPYDVKVPQGRLFLLGDHRRDSLDSRFFTDHGGTVPAGAVEGRVTDGYAVVVLLAVAALAGLLLLLAGLVCVIAARVRRRRAAEPAEFRPARL